MTRRRRTGSNPAMSGFRATLVEGLQVAVQAVCAERSDRRRRTRRLRDVVRGCRNRRIAATLFQVRVELPPLVQVVSDGRVHLLQGDRRMIAAEYVRGAVTNQPRLKHALDADARPL